jgi:hypothetical protein
MIDARKDVPGVAYAEVADAELAGSCAIRHTPRIKASRPRFEGLLIDRFPFRDDTVVSCTIPKLAQAIYDECTFDRMPILADALEEAGCDNEEILEHCRGPGPHVNGCWVVDLVLRKK